MARIHPSAKFLAGVLLPLVAFAVFAAIQWGTRWRIPRGDAGERRYALEAYWDGSGSPSGTFERPIGIAVAPAGDIYVTDARHRVVRLSSLGEFRGEWGREGNEEGGFSNPVGIAVAPDGSVYVGDYNQDRIQKFTSEGQFLLAFGEPGSGPGRFDAPSGLAVDASGSLYVADFYNHRVQKFTAEGRFQKVIGRAGRIGEGALNYPTGVHVLTNGQLLVADAYNYQLQWFDIEGQTVRRRGYHLFWVWPRPLSSESGFNVPTGVASGPDGIIHVADSGNHRVVMLSREGKYLTEWAVSGVDPSIYSPEQIAVSLDGATVYATDFAANRILVLSVGSP